MSGVSKSNRSLLNQVLDAAGASRAVKRTMRHLIASHGEVPPAFQDQWRAVLDACEREGRAGIAAEARRIYGGGEPTADELVRSAQRFASDTPPVSQKEIVRAWLESVGVNGAECVRSLSADDRETLAHIAAHDATLARQLVAAEGIRVIASIEDVLRDVRILMERQSVAWKDYFTRVGLFSDRRPQVARALIGLRQLARIASEGRRAGMYHANVKRTVPWPHLREALSASFMEGLQNDYSPLLADTGKGFVEVAHEVSIDVLLVHDRAVSVTDATRGKAFSTNPGSRNPVHFVKQQLLVYKLMAVAVADNLRGVEVILYGGRGFDRVWAEKMQMLARVLGKGFMITYASQESDGGEKLFGEMPPPAAPFTPVPASKLKPLMPPEDAPASKKNGGGSGGQGGAPAGSGSGMSGGTPTSAPPGTTASSWNIGSVAWMTICDQWEHFPPQHGAAGQLARSTPHEDSGDDCVVAKAENCFTSLVPPQCVQATVSSAFLTSISLTFLQSSHVYS